MRGSRLPIVAWSTLAACAGDAAWQDPAGDDLGRGRAPLSGGVEDAEHPAVVRLLTASGLLCSGTTVRASAGRAHLLTAAHCVTELAEDGSLRDSLPGQLLVVPGSGGEPISVAFPVEAVHVPATYSGRVGDDDIALVRYFFGAEPSPPTLPAALSANDGLFVGTELSLVGFGETERGIVGERRRVSRVVAGLEAGALAFAQFDGRGACPGDSGGPGLASAGEAGEVVVAVISGGISFAGAPCASGVGLAVRVSAHADFLRGVLDEAQACESCEAEAFELCEPELSECLQDGACGAYLACDAACADEPCRLACAAEHPDGFLALRRFADCGCEQCGDCSQEAAARCATPTCGFAEPEQLCPCVAERCCDLAAACAADARCEACASIPGFDSECGDSQPLGALASCIAQCETACQ